MGVLERRAREQERREREILDAALALFDRDDWQAVTIEEIAARAEIGKGTVYKHVASKDELYARLALRFHARLLRRLQAIDPGLDPVLRLGEIVRLYWEEYGAMAPGLRRVVEFCDRPAFVARLAPAVRGEFERMGAAFTAIATEVLAQGIAAGRFADRPVPRLLFLAQAQLMGALRLRASGCLPADEDDAYRQAVTAFLLAGLADATGRH